MAVVEHGRFERSLSAMTALAAAVTTAEIYVERYRASFSNSTMHLSLAGASPWCARGRPVRRM